MSYIPLYPQPRNTISHSSIWGPNQPRKLGSPTNFWPRMPTTSNNPDNPVSSVHDSLTTGKNLNRISYFKVREDRETTQDVFGPVMHNDPKATHAVEVRKDVGAIGDRRKKDDGCNGVAQLRDASDAGATVSSRLVDSIDLQPLIAYILYSSPSGSYYVPLRLHPLYPQSLCSVIPRLAESQNFRLRSLLRRLPIPPLQAYMTFSRRLQTPLQLPVDHLRALMHSIRSDLRRAVPGLAPSIHLRATAMFIPCPFLMA
jgi:hypothetical protein